MPSSFAAHPLRPWIALASLALAAGCQQKMASQPSFHPLEPSAFFADGSSSRHPVVGTVARGHLRTDMALFTGRLASTSGEREAQSERGGPATAAEAEPTARDTIAAEASLTAGSVTEFPLPVTAEFVEHGYHRFMIYCVVCHDPLGTGAGKIVERGYTRPPSYHSDRLRQVPPGHLFRVITEGYGSMPAYAAQIPVRDRWAIAAYVRALQLSQHVRLDDLPDRLRREWDAAKKLTAPPEQGPAPRPEAKS